MLVVHPASTCDVCLEGYTNSENLPYSIACGHVFCLRCLHSLRQHNCPLCRSPFDSADVRKIHVDRNAQSPRRTPSPQRIVEKHPEMQSSNALGLFDVSQASQLQQRVSELVLGATPISKSRVRELLQECQIFLGSEPADAHTILRSSFLLLYRFTELQSRYLELEDSNFELRSDLNRNKQVQQDWERKYKDLQRSRTRDQESARAVEASLRERLRIEELEWQRKIDYMSEECSSLRDELDTFRIKASKQHPAIGQATSSSSFYYLSGNKSSRSSERLDSTQPKVNNAERREGYPRGDAYNFFNPDLFNISPSPSGISLSSNKTQNENDDSKKQKSGSPRWKTPGTNSISRASDSAAALKRSPSTIFPIPGRPRSDSNPNRSNDKPGLYVDRRSEVSTSAPSSYMYRSVSPTRALFPPSPRQVEGDVQLEERSRDIECQRLYSLLEKTVPTSSSRRIDKTTNIVVSSQHQDSLRPPLIRCSDSQQSVSSISSAPETPMNALFPPVMSSAPTQSSAPSSPPRIQVQTSLLTVSRGRSQTISQASFQRTTSSTEQAISPIQKTPPRPVLPHMHSFALYSPAKPVSPQENRIDVRGSLPRRGSLSSASAAAAAHADLQDRGSPHHNFSSVASQGKKGALATVLATSTTVTCSVGGSPAIVPPSSLGQNKSRFGSIKNQWEAQDSD